MRRILPILLLVAGAAAAGGRPEYVAARNALMDAYFDELEPDQRDRHFEALGGWDHAEVIAPIGDIASRFGVYLVGLEGQLASTQAKLNRYKERRALTDEEIGLRNGYIRRIERMEATWRRARVSEDLLARVVGSFKEKKTVQNALTQYQKHATWRVRQLLARACAHWHALLHDEKLSQKTFAVLKKLRQDPEGRVRLAVVRALAAYRRAESLELLRLCAKDEDWRVRGATIKTLKQIGTSEAVDLLVERMQSETGRLKDDINDALVELTGENLAFAESWAAWWNGVGRKLPTKKKPASKDGQDASLKAKDTARFYGIPTRSERICFIIDISGSMNKEVKEVERAVITGRKNSDMPVEGKTRLEVAKNELKRAVTNLNPQKLFNILFFNQAVKVWQKEMVKASRKGKELARGEVQAVVASGTTYTLGALREAFVIAGVIHSSGGKKKAKGDIGIDTIFLLSDGGPTDNRMDEAKPMDPEIILDAVRQWNRDAGIVIHTIAVDTEAVGTYFLSQLAAQNGGRFVERRE
ncbi:MAG: HEAT repeat domain-containing protein [Planctomycetota bacterium]|jgi:Mg-chelatase subunit ChlD